MVKEFETGIRNTSKRKRHVGSGLHSQGQSTVAPKLFLIRLPECRITNVLLPLAHHDFTEDLLDIYLSQVTTL